MIALPGAKQLWNPWEIQCLVLASFSLQVFLFIFAGIRKRRSSRVLSLLLWTAYLLADYLVTFTLGCLTLYLDDTRHQLLLFWTPFLLLHLGGQETIVAFSTEDGLLWKRHLLGSVSHVILSVYIVATKSSWHVVNTKQLLVPMVLMFIAGTIKYAERTWALMTTGVSMTPGSSSSMPDFVLNVESNVIDDAESYFQRLDDLLQQSDSSEDKMDYYQGIVGLAGKGFRMCLGFLTDMAPYLMWNKADNDIIDRAVGSFRSSMRNYSTEFAYKLAEIQLSLIYDFMYTKYGVLQYHLSLVNSGIERLVTLGATSAALVLFRKADLDGQFVDEARADVMVSYVLLVGAVTLDLSATFMVISSYWPYLSDGNNKRSAATIMFSLTELVHPLGRGLWSGQMAQYNLVGECIQEKQANTMLVRALRKAGLVSDVKHIQVSHELKEFLFRKLLDIAATRHVTEYWKWDLSTFRGQWARWKLEATPEGSSIDQSLLQLEGGTVAAVVLMWHLITEMCFYTASTTAAAMAESDDDKNSSAALLLHRDMSRQLSEYVMYLVGKRGVKNASNGQFEFGKLRRDVRKALAHQRFSADGGRLEQGDVILYGCEGRGFFTSRASAAARELLKITRPAERWEIVATVWTEMLCYLANNCEAAFHIKHLSTGGELVTHVRVLTIILGIPFMREAWQAKAKDDAEYSDFVMF